MQTSTKKMNSWRNYFLSSSTNRKYTLLWSTVRPEENWTRYFVLPSHYCKHCVYHLLTGLGLCQSVLTKDWWTEFLLSLYQNLSRHPLKRKSGLAIQDCTQTRWWFEICTTQMSWNFSTFCQTALKSHHNDGSPLFSTWKIKIYCIL